MSRTNLSEENISEPALKAMQLFYPETVSEVANAVLTNKIVVIGMSQNPIVSKVRKLFNSKNYEYTYLEYGSYFSEWKKRLAIKLWSGWPTYPQVFIEGKLVGGCKELKELIEKGKLY
ncbi:glutaredoxin [Bacteriovoracaceae bacterium]|nr:glutaredoxin [Bacteriovoracaceae bacterium]